MKSFLKLMLNGFASITLFPPNREYPQIKIMSDEEAFRHDQEMVGRAMWQAIDEIAKVYPEVDIRAYKPKKDSLEEYL